MAFSFSGNWWNTNYVFALPVVIDPVSGEIPIGHPVEVLIPTITSYDMGKIRNDLQDVEVVYQVETDLWETVPSTVDLDGSGNVRVRFGALFLIPAIDHHYFIFYGNNLLVGVPSVPQFADRVWPLDTGLDGVGISYTRPGEDWKDGVSDVIGAIVTFTGYAKKIRALCTTYNHGGVIDVKLDKLPSTQVDVYSDILQSNVPIVTENNLDSSLHRLQLKVSGAKHPHSLGINVFINDFQWEKYIAVSTLAENVNIPAWSSYIVGI